MIRRYLEGIGGNRVVLALSVARLGDGVGNSILFIVLPLLVAKLPAPVFSLPESVRVGILISFYGLANAALQPFTGAWSDHIGRRKPFIQAGLLVMAAGTLAFLVANRFVDLFIMRAFQGVGVALTVPAALALMASASETRTRGGSMGIYTTLRMVGLSIGPLIGGSLVDRLGFDATFYAGAAFIFVGVLLVQIWVEDLPVSRPKGNPQSFQIIDQRLLTPGILGAGFATFVMASDFSMLVTLERQFNTRLDETAFAFSIAFSALMISRLMFQVPLGQLSDRVGRKPLIISGLILMVPATALLGYAASTLQLIGLRLFQGLASAAIAAPAFAVAGDMAQAGGEGRQMSIVTMGFGLGIALGPLIAGVLAVSFFQLPFLIGGLLTLISAFVVFRYVPETVRRDEGEEGGDQEASTND
jgi:MFS family permease